MRDAVKEVLWLNELQRNNLGYTATRPILDGAAYATIVPFMFTFAIIVGRMYDDDTYENRWCYNTYVEARTALESWDGAYDTEPQGWHRHPPTGRRRPNGDASQEYVNQ